MKIGISTLIFSCGHGGDANQGNVDVCGAMVCGDADESAVPWLHHHVRGDDGHHAHGRDHAINLRARARVHGVQLNVNKHQMPLEFPL